MTAVAERFAPSGGDEFVKHNSMKKAVQTKRPGAIAPGKTYVKVVSIRHPAVEMPLTRSFKGETIIEGARARLYFDAAGRICEKCSTSDSPIEAGWSLHVLATLLHTGCVWDNEVLSEYLHLISNTMSGWTHKRMGIHYKRNPMVRKGGVQ